MDENIVCNILLFILSLCPNKKYFTFIFSERRYLRSFRVKCTFYVLCFTTAQVSVKQILITFIFKLRKTMSINLFQKINVYNVFVFKNNI